MLVKDIMIKDPYILYEEDTVLKASKFMKEERIRNLAVVDKQGKLVGLITLREIIETVFKNPDKILVKDAMIKLVTYVYPEDKFKEAIEIMSKNKYGCLPVVDKDKKLLGIVTESDLLKTLYNVAHREDLLKVINK